MLKYLLQGLILGFAYVAPIGALVKVAADCFVVTWLNPQAIVDGTLLLGGM